MDRSDTVADSTPGFRPLGHLSVSYRRQTPKRKVSS